MRTTTGIAVLLSIALCAACGSGEPSGGGEQAVATTSAPAEPLPVVPEELFAAVEKNPDDPLAHRGLAVALFRADRRRESLKYFERLVELDPSARHLLDLGLAYAAVSRLKEAESVYGRLLDVSPEDPVALHNLGNLALQRGDTGQAIELYRRAIRARPDYLLAHFHLGEALKQAEQYRESYRTFEGVLLLEPKDPQELEAFDDSLYQLASLDLTMGAHQRAARMLEELLKANPDHPNAHYAYGRALMLLGRPEDAQREFDTHMRILAQKKPSGPVATNE